MRMQHPKILLAIVAPLVLSSSMQAAEPFALVELFTSEGCSSCPPADRLASALVEESEADGRNIYVLSFHVDYWDRLGWKDPYSTAEASARQRAYKTTLRERNVYTPQMVVNGSVGFVGSDRARAQQEIDKALERPAPVEVVAQVRAEGVDDLEVRARVEMEVELIHRDWEVVAAVVERGLSQEPDRGENVGRTLEHDNVVRVFAVGELEGDDAVLGLKVPSDVDRKKSDVIVYVQDKRTRKILGVTRVALPDNE